MREQQGPSEAPADDGVSAWWEPWRPKIGQRVRVRLNGECDLMPCPGSYYDRIGQRGHSPYEDGVTGVVTDFKMPNTDVLARQGHTIDVEYDVHCRPEIGDGRRSRGGTYCALELELA